MFRIRSSILYPANVLAATSLWFLSFLVSAVAADPMVSDLWGRDGEKWSADSRLPDFSWAGYHRGEKRLPVLVPDCSVRDFGAVGDGKTDDRNCQKSNNIRQDHENTLT